MSCRFLKNVVLTAMVVFGLAGSVACRADLTIHSGWDLLITDPANTSFGGVNWEGVPYTTFNFGGSIGVQNVGRTDTIIYRENNVTDGVNDSTPLDMVGWQLRTVDQVDFDGLGPMPFGYYYLTLQSAQASIGTMFNVTFAGDDTVHGGTFDSSLAVYYDLRFGDLAGTVVNSGNCTLNSVGNTWTNIAPSFVPTEFMITNVNFWLSGTDTTEDFWAQDKITHVDPGNSIFHTVGDIPEPTTFGLIAVGLVGLALMARRRRSK